MSASSHTFERSVSLIASETGRIGLSAISAATKKPSSPMSSSRILTRSQMADRRRVGISSSRGRLEIISSWGWPMVMARSLSHRPRIDNVPDLLRVVVVAVGVAGDQQ